MYDEKALSYEDVMRFMESAPANIFFKDTEGRYRFVTEVCEHFNGGPEHSIIGKNELEAQRDPEWGRFYYEDDLKILSTGEPSEYVNDFSTEAAPVFFEIKKAPVFKDGEIIGIIGVVNDVTSRALLERELEELSFTDKLTGLRNRNYLESRVRDYVRGDDFPCSLIAGDCNYLKQVNDNLGHEYGDMLLRRVAAAIKETVPEDCIPMRVGGDEFLILCPKHNEQEAKDLIGGIEKACDAKADAVLCPDVSFGSYTIKDDKLPFKEALRRADRAMYENKRRRHIRP